MEKTTVALRLPIIFVENGTMDIYVSLRFVVDVRVVVSVVMTVMMVSMTVIVIVGAAQNPEGFITGQSASAFSAHQVISNEASSNSRPARSSGLIAWHVGHSPNKVSAVNSA